MALNLKFNPKELLSGLFGQSGGPVAVDFGATGIKILAVEPGQPPRLEAIGFEPTPVELRSDIRKRFALQFEQLSRLTQKLGLRGRKVVCSIPATQTFCKHMQFERSPDVPLSILAESAVAQQIGCDPSALVYQTIDVGPLASDAFRNEIICTAASRELVTLIMQATRNAKLELAGVHGEFVALVRGFDHITKRADDALLGSLYLDIGDSCTKVVIVQGTRIVFVRFVEIGTSTLDVILKNKRGCTLQQAATLRLEHSEGLSDEVPVAAVAEPVNAVSAGAAAAGGLGLLALMPQDRRRGGTRSDKIADDAPLAEIAEQVEILADEVQMCVRYAESVVPGLRIDRLMCMGGGAADRTLCRRIAKTLHLPAQQMDPLARLARKPGAPAVNVDLTKPHPEWAVAVGLCSCPLAL
ncbi:MAG TPA: pilus assembly protein PilM [Phycisphaerales bacterium]|nr:pilus assembly protein PilM [Phycisphaerales bacterium]